MLEPLTLILKKSEKCFFFPLITSYGQKKERILKNKKYKRFIHAGTEKKKLYR